MFFDIQKEIKEKKCIFLFVKYHHKCFKRNFKMKNFREWNMIGILGQLYILLAEGTAIYEKNI